MSLSQVKNHKKVNVVKEIQNLKRSLTRMDPKKVSKVVPKIPSNTSN